MKPGLSNFINRRTVGVALAGFGALVLFAALIAIMVTFGTPLIWDLAAHEDGVRTFGGTFFYFEHAVRELPGDLLLGVVVGGSLAYAYPLRRDVRGAAVFAGALAIAVAVMLIGAARDVGIAGVIDNLLQKHTRPGAPLEWGAHWRYHLLSSLSLYLMSFGSAGLMRALDGAGTAAEAARGKRLVAGAFLAFLGLTLVFAHSPAGIAKPFADAIYIGHEARELFNAALATLPIAWGVGLISVGGSSITPGKNAPEGRTLWFCALGGGVALGVYLCAKAVLMDSASSGQTDNVVLLIAPHFFEHAQTYAVVTFTALFVHRLAAK